MSNRICHSHEQPSSQPNLYCCSNSVKCFFNTTFRRQSALQYSFCHSHIHTGHLWAALSVLHIAHRGNSGVQYFWHFSIWNGGDGTTEDNRLYLLSHILRQDTVAGLYGGCNLWLNADIQHVRWAHSKFPSNTSLFQFYKHFRRSWHAVLPRPASLLLLLVLCIIKSIY